VSDLDGARSELLAQLREHALIIGDVTLASGRKAGYYIDARRALLRPEGFRAAGKLVAAEAAALGAQAVGGPATAAIPVACSALAVEEGSGLRAFFVRKEAKQHGLQRAVEGAVQSGDRVLVVEDTVTTGGSTVEALEQVRAAGLQIAGVLAVVDRLAGGGERISEAAGAPYRALTNVDEIYPERDDR
jgi:orotate phosphoribosyltransferase